jgi:multicomponent Na+:H+ antiporter subunit F
MSLLMLLAILSGLCGAAGVFRLLVGPTMTDRVIGLDLLFALAIMLCLIAAWNSHNTVFIDVAIGLALTGLIATLSWARMIDHTESRHLHNEEQ